MEYIYQVRQQDLSDMPKVLKNNCVFMNGSGKDITLPVTIEGKQVTDFDGEIAYKSQSDMHELMYYSSIGALLWKKSNGEFVVNNGRNPKCYANAQTGDYVWDPTAIETTFIRPTHDTDSDGTTYTLIGVCVGYGMWAYIEQEETVDVSTGVNAMTYVWTPLTTGMSWASSSETSTGDDSAYQTFFNTCCHDYSGYNQTQTIMKSSGLSDSIWELISTIKTNKGYDLYIPSKLELLDIQQNCCDNFHDSRDSYEPYCSYSKNLGQLLSLVGPIDDSSYYWCSTVYPDVEIYNYAVVVYFYDGGLDGNDKSDSYKSISLLHF